jgi:hypothetical protein
LRFHWPALGPTEEAVSQMAELKARVVTSTDRTMGFLRRVPEKAAE